LRHLQLGGEALRPNGLLGVVLLSFILLAEKLADELLSVFRNTKEGRTFRIGGFGGRRGVIPASR